MNGDTRNRLRHNFHFCCRSGTVPTEAWKWTIFQPDEIFDQILVMTSLMWLPAD